MDDILVIAVLVGNLVLYVFCALKEGVRATDYIVIVMNTLLLAVIHQYYKELKCLLENLPK